ncbi:hypothetical protein ACVWXN_005922 [Bradyrhizobium sp. i1.4.4]|uniref:ABC transporter permease n=1 Tax=unclassified Bradyrhizobium TaxID=2631580 RepID=UPI0033919FA9
MLSLAAGYPVAYLLTKVKSRALSTLTVFLLIPLFTAFLIRTYAWIIILGREGIVNNVLMWLGVISQPLPLLNTTFAVITGTTHVLMPIAIFTMNSSMARIDHDFVRAGPIVRLLCRDSDLHRWDRCTFRIIERIPLPSAWSRDDSVWSFGPAASLMFGLKTVVLWFPRERVALVNGCMIMLGALGGHGSRNSRGNA